MPDFAPNYTPRFKLRYRGGLRNHAQVWRTPNTSGELAAGLMLDVNDFLSALAGVLFTDFAILGGEYAAQNSDVFLPVDVSPIAVTPSGGTPNTGDSPQFISFQGKTLFGNRASIYQFGISSAGDSASGVSQDYRLSRMDASYVSNALTVLEGSSNIYGIDRQTIYWHQYANLGYHAHYQRKART